MFRYFCLTRFHRQQTLLPRLTNHFISLGKGLLGMLAQFDWQIYSGTYDDMPYDAVRATAPRILTHESADAFGYFLC